MVFIYYFTYIYLLLKPYYVFKSGSIQPADIFLLLAFIFVLLLKNKEIISCAINKNQKFLIFTILTLIINLIYFVLYNDFKFILSFIYFLFIFLAIIVFSIIFTQKDITIKISNILKFNIIIQLVIFIFGMGKYYGASRYMGTFNDPNQFSYYIFSSYMLIYLISNEYNVKKFNLIIFIISIFLILISASTGMLFGMICFVLLFFINKGSIIIKNIKKYKYQIMFGLFIAIPIFLTIFFINDDHRIINKDNLIIFNRISDKLSRANSNSNSVSLAQERGYDRFIYYPQYIIFGSGEGGYYRFTDTYHQGEIHATFPSILFYYGIIPFIILISWIKDKLKGSKKTNIIAIVALFIESFTLLNQRQVLFWIIILFMSYINKHNDIFSEKVSSNE